MWLLYAALLVIDILVISTSVQTLSNINLKRSAWSPMNSYLRQYPVLILPGFAQSQIDYCQPLVDKPGLAHALKRRGLRNVEVLPIRRSDWVQLVPAVFFPCFWQNSCTPVDLFGFYLDMVHERVLDLHTRTKKPVILVGHSAGGWLARALMADGVWRGGEANLLTSNLVAGLITLGTPHYPPSGDVLDPSRGALAYVHNKFPGAYLQDQGIFYITVAGDAIHGDSTASRGSSERLVSQCYLSVTGNLDNKGDERGDGIVPISYAHLEGAHQLTIEDVWHGHFDEQHLWYGSSNVADKWLSKTLDVLKQQKQSPRG